jgi:octaprenyl-diphosphate synthase
MTAPATASAPTVPDLRLLRELVAADLVRVNRVILDYSKSDIALINQLAEHIIAAGGKRLRPCLTLASASACGYQGERHVQLAACVEFIHTATLLHDDVVDASALRRGTATANALWGNKTSVLVGDFLFSRAFQLMVADGELAVLKILSDTSAMIAAGEVHQLMVSHDLTIAEATYIEVIRAKTAVLFSAACEVGAVISARPEWQAPLKTYGEALGLAFQIADDTLDYQASEAELGKSIGDDFRDGKVTLPVIYAYARGNEQERNFWESALETGEDISSEHLQRARELLVKHQAFAYAMQQAQAYADAAIAALSPLPESPAKQALIEAALFTVSRSH